MFKDILNFLKSISFIDYIFFFTVIFLIILVVSLIYFIKINEEALEESIANDDSKEKQQDNIKKENDKDDLKVITESLMAEEEKPVKFTTYEQEQEEKAIISYDELLSNTGEFKLNYVEDEKNLNPNVNVKKVDLNNMVNVNIQEKMPKLDIKVISLKEEEAFLKALKELQMKLH